MNGITILRDIPHEGGKINFVYPPFRGYYGEVSDKIMAAGLKKPSSSETVSLIYDSWKNPKGECESKVLETLDKDWFWEFAGNLYLPKSNEEVNNGVIIEQNTQIINGRLNMDKNSLIRRLQENDPLVKFVPFGFKILNQSLKEFEKNEYILARYGEEGASKLTEIASKYKKQPRLQIIPYTDQERVGISALDDSFAGKRLVIIGINWFEGPGYAFGISD